MLSFGLKSYNGSTVKNCLIKSNLFSVAFKIPYDLAVPTLIYNPISSLSYSGLQSFWFLKVVPPIDYPLPSYQFFT